MQHPSNLVSLWQKAAAAPWQAQSAWWQAVNTIQQQRARAMAVWMNETPAYLQKIAQSQTPADFHKHTSAWLAHGVAQACNLAADTHATRTHLLATLQTILQPATPQASLPPVPPPAVKTPAAQAKPAAQPKPKTTKPPNAAKPTPKEDEKPAELPLNTAPVPPATLPESAPAPTADETTPTPHTRLTGGHNGAVSARLAAAASARRSVVARRSRSRRAVR